MGVDTQSITYIGVFLEGLMAFISPCILPLIPLYMSYLSSGAKSEVDGVIKYDHLKVFLTTLCFVLGISTTFFIMGLSLDFVRNFISDYQNIITLVGGVLLVFFALNQIGLIDIKPLNKEYRIDSDINKGKMNYFKAYLLGFIFSFAWTPCVGPMLANVLIMAASSEAAMGNLLIALYALGFMIPFLLLGLFFTRALSFIKAKKAMLMNLSRIAAIIIMFFGVTMIIDASNEIITIQNKYNELLVSSSHSESVDTSKLYDFSLKDQYGKTHILSDYEGKYVIMNFVSSWCGYCKQEIPAYHEYAVNKDDVVYFYVMSDVVNTSSGGSTTDEFVKEYNVTVPVLYDDGTMFNYLGVNSFPTMVYIGPNRTIIGYQSGMMSKDNMIEVEMIARQMFEGVE